ncbi:hypothetical protein ACJRO7_023754 [Eucalyptus globulus]|uniref:Secreted protein n=1 Tax=Eucalyptus globulus TaxID=34317 RepID=A0ABD3K2Y4_EUCGL
MVVQSGAGSVVLLIIPVVLVDQEPWLVYGVDVVDGKAGGGRAADAGLGLGPLGGSAAHVHGVEDEQLGRGKNRGEKKWGRSRGKKTRKRLGDFRGRYVSRIAPRQISPEEQLRLSSSPFISFFITRDKKKKTDT